MKVERGSATDWALFARQGKDIDIEGLTTDGTKCTLSVTATGAIERYAAHQGTYLRFNDKTLFSAEVKATIAFGSLEKNRLYGFADVPSDHERSEWAKQSFTSIAIFVEGNPQRIEIDEVTAERDSFTYDETENLLTLRLKKGAHQIAIWF